jgi:hypothetical protein
MYLIFIYKLFHIIKNNCDLDIHTQSHNDIFENILVTNIICIISLIQCLYKN